MRQFDKWKVSHHVPITHSTNTSPKHINKWEYAHTTHVHIQSKKKKNRRRRRIMYIREWWSLSWASGESHKERQSNGKHPHFCFTSLNQSNMDNTHKDEYTTLVVCLIYFTFLDILSHDNYRRDVKSVTYIKWKQV